MASNMDIVPALVSTNLNLTVQCSLKNG